MAKFSEFENGFECCKLQHLKLDNLSNSPTFEEAQNLRIWEIGQFVRFVQPLRTRSEFHRPTLLALTRQTCSPERTSMSIVG
jgi:hypothetical protein